MPSLQTSDTLGFLVTQHNSLVRAKYSYTQREIKISRLITSKVNPYQEYIPGSGLVVKITPEEVKMVLSEEGKTYKGIWKDFRNIVSSLNKKPIQINTDTIEGDIYWTQSCLRNKDTGEYQVRLTEDITPFIMALKEGNFTTTPLELYHRLKSKHLSRLYEILYSYRSMRGGKVTYKSWKELAEQTGWTGKVYGHFKNRVLSKAEEVFQKETPITFSYEEKKRLKSRAVEGLVFTITPQNRIKKPAQTLFPEYSENFEQTEAEIRHQLVAWSVNELVIQRLIDNPFQYIPDIETRRAIEATYKHKLQYLWEKMEYTAKARNVQDEAKYLIKTLQNNYSQKQTTQKKETLERKAFHASQTAQIVALERDVSIVQEKASLAVYHIVQKLITEESSMIIDVLKACVKSPEYKNCDNTILYELYEQNKSYRGLVHYTLEKSFPEILENITKQKEEQLQLLRDKLQKIKQMKPSM